MLSQAVPNACSGAATRCRPTPDASPSRATWCRNSTRSSRRSIAIRCRCCCCGPEDFALDASRAFMREVKRTIDDGPGFAIVDRLPVERWSQSGARAVWWLLASLVARPVAQKWDGTSIYDVTDLGKPARQRRAARRHQLPSRTSIPTTATTRAAALCRPDVPAHGDGRRRERHRELRHSARGDAPAPSRSAAAALPAVLFRPPA